MPDRKYGFTKVLENTSFEDSLDKVTKALGSEGFGVLTEIDVKATLKKKLDVEFRRYTILGACNPPMAHKALLAEPEIGLLLPCNVVVQELEDGSGVSISLVDPMVMFGVVESSELASVAEDVAGKLENVLSRIED
ncbi:MAG: DUF302 domain-containing protein [Deltaproteobacteria bacterium]|nr:DUF302 domain-containing protein [Deltaproteobacteria bacterium]